MQRMKRPESCLSDLTLDRAVAGELSDSAQRGLDQHCNDCVRCSVRYGVLTRQRDEFLRKAGDWDAFTQRTAAASPRRAYAGAALALAAVAVLGLLLAKPDSERPTERLKGSASIGFFVRRDANVTRGASGERVFPADELRFTYSSDRPLQFALLYSDERAATIYYPLAEHTTQVEPGHDVPLDFGIALDEQPGTERAFGLFCEQPQRLEPLRLQLQNTEKLSAPTGCHVDVLVLQKRPK